MSKKGAKVTEATVVKSVTDRLFSRLYTKKKVIQSRLLFSAQIKMFEKIPLNCE